MRSFPLAVLLAALTQPGQGFLTSSSTTHRPTFVATVGRQPLSVSTELATESSADGSAPVEEEEAEASPVEIPFVEDPLATTETTTAEADASSEETTEAPAEVVRNTLFVGNIPFGT